jgi:uncharacterized membrane protein
VDSAPWNQSPTIRYITYGFSAVAFVITWRHIRQDFFSKKFTVLFDCIMHFALLSVLTYEILQLIAYVNEDRVYRRGLSILWASYALMLIVIGIWRQKKHLRIFAISIFGITLLKLFLFDLNKLSSLARSGLFILMGLFLLLISYLYLRYRHKIFGDKDEVA